jgi:Bacterial Ig-like domain (group 3)
VGDFNADGKPDLAATDFLGGDVSVLINTSPAPITTTPVATTTSLTADTSTVVFGQMVALTATVTGASGTPAGTVTFCDGGTVLAEVALDPNGHASLQVQLSVGMHSLKASFAGVGGFTSSTATLSETANQAATTTSLAGRVLTIPIMGEHLVLLTATITPVAPGAGVPTGTVTFFEAGNVVGAAQVSNGQATLTLYTLPPGKHILTASYSGDANFQTSTSDAFVLNV